MLADMSTQIGSGAAHDHSAARSRGPHKSPFPDPNAAAQAKLFASEMAIKVTNDALQVFGAKGYSRNTPLNAWCATLELFTIGGGYCPDLRTVIASRILDRRLPQTRDGYARLARKAQER